MLYGMADTARHLAEAVSQINSMRPQPDLVLITGDLVCGYYPWPNNVDAERIDKSSNMGWEDLKDRMRGSMVVKNPR